MPRLTIDIDDEIVEGLAIFGEPSDVLVRLARSAGAVGRGRLSERRPAAEDSRQGDADQDSAVGAIVDATIFDLREANARMVGTAIRAQELAGEAAAATQRAEDGARDLRTVAEFREMFIGILAHDLRAPLNTMVLASGVLLGQAHLREGDLRLAERIGKSGRRMARMIDQVVDFTRARLAGGFALNVTPTDMGDVCENVVEELRLGSATVIHHSAVGDLEGTWDADRLAQAISNIAGNAVSHAKPGTAVVVRALDHGEAVVVEVTNEGVPIGADLLPVIFEAFRGGRSTRTSVGGHLGLGLYIASEIVRSHGGTIAARPGEGTTTFEIRVPRVVATRRSTDRESELPPTTRA